jgi:phosphatidylethanolamine/phosphatidyl-N-methylethanolamine N-methyltransferase
MDTVLLREFLRSHTGIAAVTPSSTAIATLLSRVIPERGEPVVVELGAGTGACTSVIQHRLSGRGHHIAVEVNPTFAKLLSKRYQHVQVVCGEAKDLPHSWSIGGSRPQM